MNESSFENPNVAWEWIKFQVRSFSIKYSITKNRERNKFTKQLEDRLALLAHDHDMTGSPDIVEEVSSIKRELSEIYLTRANEAIMRSRSNWSLLGERPTSYFLGLEKRLAKDKTITALRNKDGNIVTSNKDILATEKEFFENIYKEDSASLSSLDHLPISPEDVPRISEQQKTLMDLPFSPRELFSALKELGSNKCPGSDGITKEFYLAFWHLLQEPYQASLLHSLQSGSLSEEQKVGTITLIPKKDSDRLSLSSWRPITLLNNDLKIFSKAIAKRIQSVIRDIVSEDQTGFIKGRKISSNLANIQNIIDYTNYKQQTGLLLAIDYTKAFDTIRWDLILKALQLFGFGQFMQDSIKLLFTDIKSCIFNAGFSSGHFYPQRGIRQGCCASPALFVLTVELLATLVRKNVAIRGISVAKRMAVISQYADDTTFFISDFIAMQTLLDLINQFSKWSGLKINTFKSHLLLLGHHLHPPLSFMGIRVVSEVKILGMHFSNNMTEDRHYELNFEPQIKKIQSICSSWSNRNLSLKGKITVINSLLISLLQYQCSSSFVPSRVLKEYKNIATSFLWSGKKSKIAYNNLIQDIPSGGLKLADLETRIHTSHISWIKHIASHQDSLSAQIIAEMSKIDEPYMLLLTKNTYSNRFRQSFKHLCAILHTWERVHNSEPRNEETIKEEFLWHNKFITIENKPIWWRTWSNAGVNLVNDIIHETLPRFLSHSEISERYHIPCTFLQALQIRSALPGGWRTQITRPAKPFFLPKLFLSLPNRDRTEFLEKSSKHIYFYILPQKISTHTSQDKWASAFPTSDFSNDTLWQSMYKLPFQCLRETKLQAFQFKILYRIIPCNQYLKQLRIIQSDSCNYCDGQDTIEHFLFNCPKVQNLWTHFCAWFDRETQIDLTVSLEEYLLGVTCSRHNIKVVNTLILYFKFFVYIDKNCSTTVISISCPYWLR